MHATDRVALMSLRSLGDRCVPQRLVQGVTRETPGRARQRKGIDATSLRNELRTADDGGTRQRCRDLLLQYGQRLPGEKLAADFVAGKLITIPNSHAHPQAPCR